MTSIRGLFCAVLLAATAIGCGGSTSAETVPTAADEMAAVELEAANTAQDGGSVEAPSRDAEIEAIDAAEVQSSETGTATQSSVGLEPGTSDAGQADDPAVALASGATDAPTAGTETAVEDVVVQLRRRTFLDGALSLDVPADFQLMSRSKREQRYAAGQRPSVVLTNADSDVNIAFNLTPNEMEPGQRPDFQRQMASLFRSQVASGDWGGSSGTRINGLDWFTIEMRTEALETKVWNLIAGTSFDGRLLLVSFNATAEREEAWKPHFRTMLQSVRLAAEPLKQPEI